MSERCPGLAQHLSTCLAALAIHARVPEADDAPFLAALYASTRPDLVGGGAADPAFVAALMAMQQRLQAADYAARFPQAATLVLASASAPCGRVVVDDDGQRVRLVDLALWPADQGRGLGSAILLALQQWACARQLPVMLAVQRGNVRARRLYDALGFVPVAGPGAAAEERVWPSPGVAASIGLAH